MTAPHPIHDDAAFTPRRWNTSDNAQPAPDSVDLAELEDLIAETADSDGESPQTRRENVHQVLRRADRLHDECYAVGVELLPYYAVAALTGSDGTVIGTSQRKLESMDVAEVVSQVGELVRELTGDFVVRSYASVAVGLHLAGPVDSRTNWVHFYGKHAPDRQAKPAFVWRDVPLGQLIEAETGLIAAVENDANAFARYQRWFGAGRDVDKYALVLVRDGVGGAMVVDGKLFDGPFEIGNLVVYPEGGRTCDCGNRGCLEVTAGGYGIAETAAAFAGHEIDSAAQAAALAEGSSETANKVQAAFSAAGIAIGKALGFIATLVAPPRIILYGPSFMVESGSKAADAFLQEASGFRRYISHDAFRGCELVIAPLQPYEGAQAAAIVALENRLGITRARVHTLQNGRSR